MSIDIVTEIAKNALYTIIKISAPILMISMVIGLIISIFQTVTSIQEQTLTFVPKIICTFIGLMLLGNWMLTELVEFIVGLWANFSIYIR